MMAVTKCRDVSREFIQAQQCMGDNCSLCSLPGSQQTVYCRHVDMIEPRESVILVLMIFIMRILMIWIFIFIVVIIVKLVLIIIFNCRHLYFLIKYYPD